MWQGAAERNWNRIWTISIFFRETRDSKMSRCITSESNKCKGSIFSQEEKTIYFHFPEVMRCSEVEILVQLKTLPLADWGQSISCCGKWKVRGPTTSRVSCDSNFNDFHGLKITSQKWFTVRKLSHFTFLIKQSET